MLLATLLFAAALQQCGTYNGPADGAIHVCGHSYKLVCTRSGSSSSATRLHMLLRKWTISRFVTRMTRLCLTEVRLASRYSRILVFQKRAIRVIRSYLLLASKGKQMQTIARHQSGTCIISTRLPRG